MATPRLAEQRPATGPMVPEPFCVLAKRRDTEDTWTLELEAPRGGPAPSFEPGQFNMLYAFGAGEVPISICGDPAGEEPLAHTVRSVGAATAAICETAEGGVLGVRGPFGSAWPLASAEGRDLVIVAGGIGLAPLRPALLSALRRRERFNRVVLLYGGRTPAQLLYRDELRRWAEDGAEVAVTVDTASNDWNGRVGVVTRLFDEVALDPSRTLAMLCGPELMMRFAIQGLAEAGVEPGDIHISIERNMKCAITQCGRCQFGPTFACREGPVMCLADIEAFLAIREV
jgi:NAD(P)H-flavin reductase